MASVLRGRGHERRVLDFTPSGYDERQYNSPGYNLPIGCFMRTPWGEYPEYHTSADDLDFVTPKALADSFEIVRAALEVVEESPRYRATHPYGEPQLGPRGLWAVDDPPDRTEARLWVLNLSDGEHSLFDVADRSGLPLDLVKRAAAELLEAGLLKR
jgi:aminopeptidase-like protein